jgi:sensor domain CHASE-containing protein
MSLATMSARKPTTWHVFMLFLVMVAGFLLGLYLLWPHR